MLPSSVLQRIRRRLREAQALGSYHLIELLGRGGMGEVWRAEHVMLARPAVIKLIRTAGSAAPSREVQKRFEREARATARLSSPHTVQIYDYGTTDEGTFYYVMELLDGFDLDTLVKKFGPVPPERAIHLLRQACGSLAEAHARGLIHRDIKPANIFITEREHGRSSTSGWRR
jgi:eukaryotic-like serine/threonine-protein kinase